MCDFYSAIVMKNGDILDCAPNHSHEIIIDTFKIKDNNLYHPNFMRVECIPVIEDGKIEEWEFHYDNNINLKWFSKTIQEKVKNELIKRAKKYIIDSDVGNIHYGYYLLLKGAYVWKATQCTLECYSGSCIKFAKNSDIRLLNGAECCEANSSDIYLNGTSFCRSVISCSLEMDDFSKIQIASLSRIESACDNSIIKRAENCHFTFDSCSENFIVEIADFCTSDNPNEFKVMSGCNNDKYIEAMIKKNRPKKKVGK